MPFTPTHIAAAIPFAWLCRWRVPFTALAIGTTVSDIPVYFPMLLPYQATHTMTGVVTHCLPLGLLLYFIYHGLLKRPLVDLLPTALRDRLLPYLNRELEFDPKRIAVVSALIILGAVTHVFWDSFTHRARWGTIRFPWLNEIMIAGNVSMPWYSVLQHGSSLVLLPPMLVGFGWWLMHQPRLAVEDQRAKFPPGIAWSVFGLICLGGFIHWRMIVAARPHYSLVSSVRLTVARAGAVCLAVVLLYCVAMQLMWLLERRSEMKRESSYLEST